MLLLGIDPDSPEAMAYDYLNTCSENVSAFSTKIKYQSQMELDVAALSNSTIAATAAASMANLMFNNGDIDGD